MDFKAAADGLMGCGGHTAAFEETMESNRSLSVDGVGRFRINVFHQRGEVAPVARLIKSNIGAAISSRSRSRSNFSFRTANPWWISAK
jgi:Tfp pilus assembly pilus retraction ATPase PilT